MTGVGGFGGRRLASLLGQVGAWSFALQRLVASEEQGAAREIEALGFATTWIPESLGSKELFAHAGILLTGTDRLVIASGIANIYARDPMAMANGAKALGEAHPGREPPAADPTDSRHRPNSSRLRIARSLRGDWCGLPGEGRASFVVGASPYRITR